MCFRFFGIMSFGSFFIGGIFFCVFLLNVFDCRVICFFVGYYVWEGYKEGFLFFGELFELFFGKVNLDEIFIINN